jgi:GT2 family glycosyltransferase
MTVDPDSAHGIGVSAAAVKNLDVIPVGTLFLSVVIGTLNRHQDLLRALRYFANEETYRPFEVIVVDQSDWVDPTVRAFMDRNSDRFRAIQLSERNLPKARNAGIQLAKGEVIVFVDDDVEILPGFLAGHAAAFADTGIWGATGAAFEPGARKLVSAQSLTQKDIDDLNSGRNVMRTDFAYDTATLYGCNMSIRRSTFERIGYFDEFYEGGYCDDVDISRRIKLSGGRLRYTPAAQLVHYQQQTGGRRVNPVNSARYIRDYVRSVVFVGSMDWTSIFRMFRAMIFSRPAYRAGRMGFHQTLAFWQAVADAKREFNRRNKNAK